MNYGEDYCVTDDNLIKRLSVFRDVNEKQNLYVHIVYKRTNEQWGILAGRITEVPCEKRVLSYPNYIFVSCVVSKISLSELVSHLQGDGIPLIDDYPNIIKKRNSLSLKFIPSSHSLSGWPERVIEASLEDKTSYWDEPLIAFNQPFHETPAALMKEMLNIDEFHGNSDARLGNLIIELKDTRGRLLLSEVDIDCESTIKTGIVGYLKINDERLDLNFVKSDVAFKWAKKDVKECELVLVSVENEVLDFFSTRNLRFRNEFNKDPDSDKRREIECLIEQGESETCEFKKYIDIEKENAKSSDIEKAICAFSNNSGGCLLIGVADDGSVVGIRNEIGRTYKSDINLYIQALKKRAIEKLKYADCCTFEDCVVYGVDIVVIRVKPSKSCNMIMTNKDIFIRKGATSAKASAEEITKLTNKNTKHDFLYNLDY